MSVYQLMGDNPTLMYLRATEDLLKKGEQVSPRGKLITELRPACLEFTNPYNRVTFLEGRRINPFFQIAESLWILSGRADVEFLTKFNENMKQFSDDGKWFNAPYGERIRMWNKNTAHNIIINPIDQLADVYKKLIHDKDTRQAVIVISNPMFDNSNYTINEQGKDIACLTGDTIIQTSQGEMTLKEVCDKVSNHETVEAYSYNISTNILEYKPVVAGRLTRKDAQVYEIHLSNGGTIKATPDHQVYSVEYNPKTKAFEFPLRRVDELVAKVSALGIPDTNSPGNLKFVRVKAINPLPKTEDVYDITVEDNHNFFANGYLVHNCNLVVTFKIRHDKLNMTVFNRSNDLHWGVFGANLCQFSTLQETLLSWLKASKYPELSMGTYNQITDSLHIYLDDYGYKITNTVLANYKDKSLNDLDFKFEFPDEPRMSMNIEEFDAFLAFFWNVLNPYLMDDEVIKSKEQRNKLFGDNGLLYDVYKKNKVDDYWCFAVRSMVVYRLVKLGLIVDALEYMKGMPACQWKVSMMYFLKHFILKLDTGKNGDTRYQQAAQWYLENAKDLLDKMKIHPTYMKALLDYLELNKIPE